MDGRSIPFHRTLPTGIAHVRSLASAVLQLQGWMSEGFKGQLGIRNEGNCSTHDPCRLPPPSQKDKGLVLHLYAGCNTCGHGTRVKSGLFVCPVCEVLQCRKELTATKIP